MKKQDKIDIISKAVENKLIARMYFRYDDIYFYYYPNKVNDKFILGQKEYDFELDGYGIRKISHLDKVEIKDDECQKISEWLGVTKQVKAPDVDITSWETIFNSLCTDDKFVIIEDDENEEFYIGRIVKVFKNRLLFEPFDADGVWQDKISILYSTITHVAWNTRYSESWYRYMLYLTK